MQNPPIWLNRFNEEVMLKHYWKSEIHNYILISEFELGYINLCRITIKPVNTHPHKKVVQTISSEQLQCKNVWVHCVVTIAKSHRVFPCFLLFTRVIYEFTSSFPNSIVALTVPQLDYIQVGIKQYLLQLGLLIHVELGTGLLVLFVFI